MVGQVGFSNNFLNPTGFRFVIKRLPHVSFYVQGANVPGISIGTTEQATPFKTLYYHGDKIQYNTFSLSIRLDEYMHAFTEIKEWMEGLTSPSNFKQYADLKNDPTDQLYSDATLAVLDSRGNVSIEITFSDMFPINIGDIIFNTTDTDINYVSLDITFQTGGYKVNVIREKTMFVPPEVFEISIDDAQAADGDLDANTVPDYIPEEGDVDYVEPPTANVVLYAEQVLGDLYDPEVEYTIDLVNEIINDFNTPITDQANSVIVVPYTTQYILNDTAHIVEVRNEYPGDYNITAIDMVSQYDEELDPDLVYYENQFIEFNVYAPGHPFRILDANNELVSNTEIINNNTDNNTILWQPKTAGTYKYQCAIHPNMVGDITILANTEWLATDDIANVTIITTHNTEDAGDVIVSANGAGISTDPSAEGDSGGSSGY